MLFGIDHRTSLDRYEEIFDHVTLDTDVIWSNPDVPDYETLIDDEETSFECPADICGDDKVFQLTDDPGENDEALRTMIAQSDGTIRCDDCDEPLYGFLNGGDHRD